MNCLAALCAEPIGDGFVFCEEHNFLTVDVVQRVAKLQRETRSPIYVGRTHLPERRLLEHLRNSGRNALSVVYWAAWKREADWMESSVMDGLEEVLSSSQLESRAGGGSWSGNWYALYAAWRFDGTVNPPAWGSVVSTFPPVRRVMPDRRQALCDQIDLVSTLDRAGARAELEQWERWQKENPLQRR